jgi:hypothetical protein
MESTPTQTKQIRQTQSGFTNHAKINLKIICNTMGKNPFGQTCRDHAVSDYLRLNFLVSPGFLWPDDTGQMLDLPR